jgi:hypothetical protein
VAGNKKANLKHNRNLKRFIQAGVTLAEIRNETQSVFATEVDFTHSQVPIF